MAELCFHEDGTDPCKTQEQQRTGRECGDDEMLRSGWTGEKDSSSEPMPNGHT